MTPEQALGHVRGEVDEVLADEDATPSERVLAQRIAAHLDKAGTP